MHNTSCNIYSYKIHAHCFPKDFKIKTSLKYCLSFPDIQIEFAKEKDKLNL